LRNPEVAYFAKFPKKTELLAKSKLTDKRGFRLMAKSPHSSYWEEKLSQLEPGQIYVESIIRN